MEFIQGLLDPVSWIEENFCIRDPRDPETGNLLQPGPIRLATHHKRILKAALSRDKSGRLQWRTVIWSSPKKTGKTIIAAAVAYWFAAHHPDDEVYCLANDGAQARDRVFKAITTSIKMFNPLNAKVLSDQILFPTGTKIQAMPSNATGAAGANPGMTIFTEVWAYYSPQKKQLYTEMAASPTKFDSLTWLESYAGYNSQDSILRSLYNLMSSKGERHPSFPDLPVYIYLPSGIFMYWDDGEEARRLPWQTPEYYASQAALLPDQEFRRIHLNQWVSETTQDLPLSWWSNCHRQFQFDKEQPIVIGVDAAVTGDCFAVVAVSKVDEKRYAVPFCQVWEPHGVPLDFLSIEQELRRICEQYTVIAIAYDPYQLHDMMTRLNREWVAHTIPFSQRTQRVVADTALLHAIRDGTILHDNNPMLTAHYRNTSIEHSLTGVRFVKKGRGQNIDAIVALSMALFVARRLNI